MLLVSIEPLSGCKYITVRVWTCMNVIPRTFTKQNQIYDSMIDSSFSCFMMITSGCVDINLRIKYVADKSLLKFMIRHCFELFIYLIESPQLWVNFFFIFLLSFSTFKTRDIVQQSPFKNVTLVEKSCGKYAVKLVKEMCLNSPLTFIQPLL